MDPIAFLKSNCSKRDAIYINLSEPRSTVRARREVYRMSEQKQCDRLFDEIFSEGFDKQPEPEHFSSPMIQKLQQKEAHTIEEHYVSWLGKWPGAHDASDADSSVDVPCSKHTLLKQKEHFTGLAEENYVTVIYEIYLSWSYATKTKYAFVKKIDSQETVGPDGRKYITYFVDDVQKDGNQIVLLHFNKARHHVLVSMGLLMNQEVKIGKRPTIFPLDAAPSSKPREEGAFELTALSDNEKAEFLRGSSSTYDCPVDVDSTTMVIDTETYLPVPKKVYFENGEYKAKMTFQSGRSYFAFQIMPEDVGAGNSPVLPLSDFEIAECYSYGKGDFPKDVIKAAEMFEQIGDAKSLDMLAHIWFREGPNDADSLAEGILYLEQAIQKGDVGAKTELVYYTMKLLSLLPEDAQADIIENYISRIQEAVAAELPGALFLAAYIYEKGVFVEANPEMAFSWYLRAAKSGNRAAQARINLAPIGQYTSEQDCHTYFDQSKNQSGLPEYFMGWFLADDPAVKIKDDILYFYEAAAGHGVTAAIQELVDVYMCDNQYTKEDPAKAILWCEKLDNLDDDTAIALANYYIDGDGCQKGVESDQKAFRLLSSVVAKSENKTAYNNLGWMYKTGRGCGAPDYAKALSCFRHAADLNSKSAFYHLGDMYEHGLGVETDLRLAWEFYQKGADLGHKKCLEKVREGFPADSYPNGHAPAISLLADIHDQVSEINTSTTRMERKLDQVLAFIENDLNSAIATAKKHVRETTGDEESAIADFIENTSAYINHTLGSLDTLVEQETGQLRFLFGKTWDYLLPASKTSLVSAGVLWKTCARITKKDFDFSGVCISATSALESELKRVFYTGFQKYLCTRYGDPATLPLNTVFSVWPEKLLNKTKAACQNEFLSTGTIVLEMGNSFTLGTLPYLFWDKNPDNRKLLQQRMKEYLQTIVKDCYADNPLKYINPLIKDGSKTTRDPNSFINQCEQIRENFRNPAAHIDIISWEKADECYSEVIGKADSFRCAAQAKGLIMKLYEFLK